MKIRIEASQEELYTKSDAFIKAIIDIVHHTNPELAERMAKVLPEDKDITLKYKVLQEISDKVEKIYADTNKKMIEKIINVLNQSKTTTSGLFKEKENK